MLFRVRISGDTVVYAERIDLDTRIRDLTEGKDGRILIWYDEGQVASLALEDTPSEE